MAHAGPPKLPTVVDEAGDTPAWVPILGLCLLGIAGLWIAVAQATKSEPGVAPPVQAEAAAPPSGEAAPQAEEAEGVEEARAEPAH